MNRIEQIENRLIIKDELGTVWIEPWGKDSVRVRMTQERTMDSQNWALDEEIEKTSCQIKIEEVDTSYPWDCHYTAEEAELQKSSALTASLTNGSLTVKVNHENWISFWQGDKLLFEEQWRNRRRIDRFCVPTNNPGRELVYNSRTFDFKATLRFEAYDDEHLYGMGQYQDSHWDKKGSVLELSQKNSQASVPFVVSSRGYGFLWNNPAIGSVSFATNGTCWSAENTKKIDYWVTCGSPAQIEENYSAVTGRTPMMPDFAMGFWQCKLRYRTQEEVLEVAREYKKRNLPLDVIVIDFFHWTCQGDFKFDPKDWPDPESMVKELSQMGVKVMVSIWPTVDERSENFDYMAQNGLLISFDKKDGFNMDWMGNTVFFDTTNPETRKFVWEKCKENYFKKGIELFWLDEAEPEYGYYNFEGYSYHIGSAMQTSNIYPRFYAQGFYEGLKESGVKEPISLIRCAWAGSQKFGSVVWSGDVHSDFRSFKNQIQAGINMNMAGIPWWTTDAGGFLGGDIHSKEFRELIVRWFEWSVFCPVTRLHGERPPFKVLPEAFHEIRGHQIKQMQSGQDNEVWSFGEDVYEILSGLLFLRQRLKPYIKKLMEEAHKKGQPVMRPLMYDFYKDREVYKIEDQYMFGPKLMVCPVTDEGVTERKVYLPVLDEGEFAEEGYLAGGKEWTDTFDGKKYSGGQTITVHTPLNRIPVFSRGDFNIKLF